VKIERKVNRTIDLADGATRTYRFFEKRSSWKSPDPKENGANKRTINGGMKIFGMGTTKSVEEKRK